MGLWQRMLKVGHFEGIPWPASLLYNLVSSTSVFQRHYELVADDVASCCRSGRLLDVGTGPGWLLLKLHARLPEAQLAAVDVSPAMVSQARENLRKAGCRDAVEVLEAPAASLPFEDGSFDAVLSTGSIHHWKEPVASLNEVHRVLKPGGRALIYDLVVHMPDGVAREARRRFGWFMMALCALHSLEEPFYSTEEMEALAAHTLFGSGRIRFVGALCCLELRKQEGQ